MSDIIQLLPDHVANQIAAGEVVQRPASVVKELLENAIDAGATKISLIIKDAGKTLIQVVDNGIGMSTTDARMCFERHATSKIKEAKDLFALTTKGFRGEAMASIAAVAHVELKTKQESDELGTEIKIEGSNIVSQEPCSLPVGTSILVKRLFFNIPARRNFLKSSQVELRHVLDEFHRVAMVHHNIKFDMISNDNEVFSLPATNLKQRLAHIFGNKTSEKIVPVGEETEIVKVKGFVGKPEFAKKSRGNQYFFVNDRFIKSPYLNHAVNSAFEGVLAPKMHPSYYLYLELDPETIDINIHPTKTEVKFENEQALYSILRATVKHSLGQFSVAPSLDFNKDSSFELPYAETKKDISTPQITVDRNFNPFKQEKKTASPSKSFSTSSSASLSIPSEKKTTSQTFTSKLSNSKPFSNWEGLYANLKEDTKAIESSISKKKEEATIEIESTFSKKATPIFEESQAATSVSGVYQLQQKYLVTSIKSGLVVIHQNRAHQRVLYETFLKQLAQQKGVSQQLLFPLELSFSTMQLVYLQQEKEKLEQLGFSFLKLEGERVTIDAVPSVLAENEVSGILEQLVVDLENDVPNAGISPNQKVCQLLARQAAVKTGTRMEQNVQKHLVDQLFACETPTLCPIGKTTFITVDVNELDKKF